MLFKSGLKVEEFLASDLVYEEIGTYQQKMVRLQLTVDEMITTWRQITTLQEFKFFLGAEEQQQDDLRIDGIRDTKMED